MLHSHIVDYLIKLSFPVSEQQARRECECIALSLGLLSSRAWLLQIKAETILPRGVA